MENTLTQEQLIKQKIEILLLNVEEKLIETSEMVSTLGNHLVSHKGVKVSLNNLFDFRKMDMEGFIGYLFLSNQNKETFGDLTHKNVVELLTEAVPKDLTNQLVKSYLNK